MRSPRHIEQTRFYRSRPEKVVLAAKQDSEQTDLPPVRIYLGTEDAQYRAERVFIYSIEKVRNPKRRYEIYLMKNLAGYKRESWRTGFTLYRYAIPSLAGGTGKAIYNDVDQIYLSDPAELFDIDMGEHGYRSVSNTDTSVMLIDCERMLPIWNTGSAKYKSKGELNKIAADIPNLWGPIDPHWNARDMEYDAAQTKVLHYTMLHLQPWQPTPDSYSYHPHPLRGLWSDLEKEAIENHYRPFNAQNPSQAYQELTTLYTEQFADQHTQSAPSGFTDSQVKELQIHFGPAVTKTPALDLVRDLDFLANTSVLQVAVHSLFERIPQEDIPWVLESIFTICLEKLSIVVDSTESHARLKDGYPQNRTLQTPEWWKQQMMEIGNQFPSIQWEFTINHQLVSTDLIQATRFTSENRQEPVKAWCLATQRKGDNAQIERLTRELGWDYEIKKLSFRPWNHIPNYLLGASLFGLDQNVDHGIREPLPEYVISSGRRAAPVARWIKAASGGKTKLIHIGRPWCNLDYFDLVITTPQYQLPLRDNILHNHLALNQIDSEALKAETGVWRSKLSNTPGPYLSVIIGGGSRPYIVDKQTMTSMAGRVNTMANKENYSVLVCSSPRTPAGIVDAFTEELDCRFYAHEWQTETNENPYYGFIGLSEKIILTGDSASMASEICKLGKPVLVQKLKKRFDPIMYCVASFRNLATYGQRKASYRGTPKQQNWLARLYDKLIAMGIITSVRDLDAFFAQLHDQGAIRYLDETIDFEPKNIESELTETVRYISKHLNYQRI